MTLDGSELGGALAADVHGNNHLAADRFRVRFAASALDIESVQRPGSRLEVSVGLDGNWTSLVTGSPDSVVFDPIGGTLDLEGRDLSAAMIDARVDETFANRTSSEIAQTFADRHGLQASVDRTTTPVGRYYQTEHDRLTLGQYAKATTEWDLLAFLAGQEGFDLFMEGTTLRFGAPTTGSPVLIQPEDCISIQCEHSLSMARSIEVTVRSWGTKAGVAVVGTARGGSTSNSAWKHAITRPNLTAAGAQQLAERVLADLRRFEWVASVTMPGDTKLSPRSQVTITGTGTSWDRDYRVTELSRQLDVRRGFTQRLALQGIQ